VQRSSLLLSLIVICFVTPLRAQTSAPKPDPELKKLHVLVGHWTYEGEYKPGPLPIFISRAGSGATVSVIVELRDDPGAVYHRVSSAAAKAAMAANFRSRSIVVPPQRCSAWRWLFGRSSNPVFSQQRFMVGSYYRCRIRRAVEESLRQT